VRFFMGERSPGSVEAIPQGKGVQGGDRQLSLAESYDGQRWSLPEKTC
jgi:hypothetical protein